MKKIYILYFFIIAVFAASCSNREQTLLAGEWLFQLKLDETDNLLVLPVNAQLTTGGIVFINNEERIEVTDIIYNGDSVLITMPVFGSEFIGRIKSNTIEGYYHNYNKGREYSIPFTASYGIKERFEAKNESTGDISGSWDAWFINARGDSTKTIASFEQSGNRVTGTFFTEIGDYRYLDGVLDGNELKLSTFDGAHAFLFTAQLSEEGSLSGIFRSGHDFSERWYAIRNENASLRGMKELTYLKDGYKMLEFNFPDESGSMISLEDEIYSDKVVIVQIFGTWCPNCMDETRYLVELYNKYNQRGLEIIGLDFEIVPTLEYFRPRVKRFKNDLDVPYNIVLAGSSDKKKAAESLPMLNHILSYPTAIILDRAGDIREIHTGFSGPGTGQAYLDYKKEMEELIESLLVN